MSAGGGGGYLMRRHLCVSACECVSLIVPILTLALTLSFIYIYFFKHSPEAQLLYPPEVKRGGGRGVM